MSKIPSMKFSRGTARIYLQTEDGKVKDYSRRYLTTVVSRYYEVTRDYASYMVGTYYLPDSDILEAVKAYQQDARNLYGVPTRSH